MKGNAQAPARALEISLNVNGRDRALRVAADETLLETLRDRLGLTGTKRGCDRGACGACTVLLDGASVNACLTLSASVDGCAVRTVEGLAGADGSPSPLQHAFAVCDALQCGFCTPGQLMAATGLIESGGAGSREAIAEAMSGNLCRCGAYPFIVDAIVQARDAIATEA